MSGADQKPAPANFRKKLIRPAAAFFLLGLIFLALLPIYPGFAVFSIFFALVFFIIYAPGNIKSLASDLFSGGGKRTLGYALKALLALAVLFFAGALSSLPAVNLAAPPQAELTEDTLALLRRIPSEVKIHAYVGRPELIPQADFLLGLYSKNQPLIKTEASSSYGQSDAESNEVAAARQNAVVISAEGFRETVSPISQSAINASLLRFIAPSRVVCNLQGEGSRSANDESGRGLSLWRASLEARKIYLEDFFWKSL